MVNLILAGSLAALVGLSGCERGADTASQVSFKDDVLPIMKSNCVQCHDVASEGVATSGLNLSDYDAIMKGTRYGAVVVPGSAESSSLYLVVAHKTDPKIHMPPHHQDSMAEGRGEALSELQIETIKAWIDQGAQNN
jgi:hypothetical protein